ncbi:hypothetical protein ES703_35413 [subsurface metagenome]
MIYLNGVPQYGDAAVADVKAGKKFYGSSASQLTGTLPTKAIVAGAETYEEGYHAGNVGGLSTIDTDLAVANIKSGITIFGFLGTLSATPAFDTESTNSPTRSMTGVADHARGRKAIAAGANYTVATITDTYDANSRAVGSAFSHAHTDGINTMKLRLIMDGVQIAESGYIPRYNVVSQTRVITGQKALSGGKTCIAQLHNYSGGIDYFNVTGGSSNTSGFALVVGSVKA